MKNALQFSLLGIPFLFLMSCSTPFFAAPAATPTTTLSSTATQTPIPTPTATRTPTRTLTATPRPLVELGERHMISGGGFSVRVPKGYASQIEEHQAFISDLEGKLVISFAGGESDSPEEEIIDEYLKALAKRGQGEFEKTPANPVTVSRLQGKAFDLTGSLAGAPLKGKTFVLLTGPNRFLFALGISNSSEDQMSWEKLGSKVFEAVIQSIEIVEPRSEAACPIADDRTYGYSRENAIRVGDGGELFGGPARERAYLDNLRGPNGEPISYERLGSLNFEDTILDEYRIAGLATPVTVYLDIYQFEELRAPVGLTCAGPFNLKP